MTDDEARLLALRVGREDLFDLAERLKPGGIRLSPAQLIDLHDLLLGLRLADQLPDDLRDWRGLLAPLICHSAHEQAGFHRIFPDWVDAMKSRQATALRLLHHLRGLTDRLEGRLTALPQRCSEAIDRLLQKGWTLDSAKARAYARVELEGCFCADEQERAVFADAYRQWVDLARMFPKLPQEVLAAPDLAKPAPAKSRLPIGLAATATMLALFAALWLFGGPDTPQPPPPLAIQPPIETPAHTVEPSPPPVRKPQALPTRPIVLPPPRFHGWTVDELSSVAIVLPFALFLLWLAWSYAFRRIVITHEPGTVTGASKIRWVQGVEAKFIDPSELRFAAGKLRDPVIVSSRRIDPRRTVLATVRNAGFLKLVKRTRRVQPEYLVLIDRARPPSRAEVAAAPPNERDHQAALGEALIRQLQTEQVLVHLYYFDEDPRRCLAAQGAPLRRDLRDLAVLHGDCRLFIVSDAAGLFEFLSGRPVAWLADFEPWRQRVVLTPKPSDEWGYAEAMLALNGFAVAPSHPRSLALLADVWLPKALRDDLPESVLQQFRLLAPVDTHATTQPVPPRIERYGSRWLEDRPPDLDKVRSLLGELNTYLGPEGFLLLQALAIYPEITWPLTLALDRFMIDTAADDRRSARLLSLSRLPWLRHGQMPDYLRLALIRALPKHRHRALRQWFEQLLKCEETQDPSAIAIQIERPPPQSWWRRWFGPRPEPTHYDDHIFAKLIMGATPSVLDVEAPQILADWFPGIAWNDVMARAVVGGLASLFFAGLVWAGGSFGHEWLQATLAARQAALHGATTVRIVRAPGAVAWQEGPLVDLLTGGGFAPTVEDAPATAVTVPPTRNRVQAGAEAMEAAQWIAGGLAYLGYGREAAIETAAPADRAVADDTIVIHLAALPQVFQERFSALRLRPGYRLIDSLPADGGVTVRFETTDPAGKPRRFACGCTAGERGGDWWLQDSPPDPLTPCPPTTAPVACDDPALTPKQAYLEPEMVEIPAGSFTMGSPKTEKGRGGDEGPQHKVTIARFALGRTEVTFDEYDLFVQATGRKKPRDFGYGRGKRPVIDVDWDDARAYAAWLSEKTGKTYRLPSEAEWEYAARAGMRTSRFWGDDPAKACTFANVADQDAKKADAAWVYHDCADGQVNTAPVGSYRPNDFGLSDMLGNVWEWTADCYHASYRGAPSDGQVWEDGKTCESGRRVLRGGSWGDVPGGVRSADRYWFDPATRYFSRGFRLARTF